MIKMYKTIYDTMLDLVLKKAEAAHITPEMLEKYYIPEGTQLGQNYYCRLASSLQNGTSSGMNKSIKFNGENRGIIEEVLCGFNYEQVIERYKNENKPSESWKNLYEAFLQAGIVDVGSGERQKRIDKSKSKEGKDKKAAQKTNWEKYSRGLYEGAVFLADSGDKIIGELIENNNETIFNESWVDTIKKITDIHGVGMALACDWLKECGCTWLVKPDVHIKKVYCAMYGKRYSTTVDYDKIKDKDIIKFFFDWKNELQNNGYSDVTVYKIDKIIWLICTGEFYLDKNNSIGRDFLIKSILEKN